MCVRVLHVRVRVSEPAKEPGEEETGLCVCLG